MEVLEDRMAPAVQVYGGLEFMTTGAFNVSKNVVTSGNPVEVGVAPAPGSTFAPLLLLQSGVEFTSTDTTGTFTTPEPSSTTGGAVSAYAGGTTVPLLDAHAHTFQAPALLGSGFDVLATTDTNGADLPVAGGDLSVTGLHFAGAELDVQGSLTLPDFPGLDLAVQGSSQVALTSAGVQLTSLNVTLSASTQFREGGLQFAANSLAISYATATNEFDVSGSASLTVADNTLKIGLGTPADPGLVIADGSLASIDATVDSNLQIGGLTFTTQGLTIQATAGSNLTITGMASFSLDVAGETESLGVTLGATDSSGVMYPGIVINQSNGQLVSLDAAVDSDITIAGLNIKATNLGIAYDSATSSYLISGGASFSLDGATVSILLGGSDSPGLDIEGGQLESLQASVTGDIKLLGLDITADNLTVVYVAASGGTAAEIALFGSVGISSSFVTFKTTLGDEQNPGILVEGGQLESLNITVDGGFSLFGIDVTADGLTIQYASATNELELSGGIMLDFTSAFEVSAAISQGGLFINTSTGALSVPSTGLQISASATLGPFSIQNLMISFSSGPSGVNFSASGQVNLPGGIDVSLDELDVVDGQLADIGLSEDVPIPIGDTGFELDSLSGSLQNLNNISQLVVMASAEISFGDKVKIPSIEPFFAGGSFALVDATGSITVSASQLDLSGTVSLLGGLLGQGSASLDLNWTTGIYTVSGNFSMYDNIINFGGSLTITSAGDITLQAMASVNVPPQIPFIGGDSLGSINFYLQYEAGQPLTQDFIAAWTSVNLFVTTYTIGFEIDFQGDVSAINGNDVAALTSASTSQPAPTQYVYQQNLTVPSQAVPGSQPVGAQITASSPIFDGAYPVSVNDDTVSANFNELSSHFYTNYQLTQPYVIMSSLNFSVTIEQDIIPGGLVAGTGSFDAKGDFTFVPSGLTGSIVPTGATLYSDGQLVLAWANAPFDSYTTSITATYDAAQTYFELSQQSTSGALIPLAYYTIDPASNDSGDSVQTAVAAESEVTDDDLTGTSAVSEGGAIETQYALSHGEADPKTVTFTVYQGSTLLGSGYLDASGGFHFTPQGTPPLVPTGGSVGTDPEGDGIFTLDWPKIPGQTTANVQYASIGNRLIDFSPSTLSSASGVPGQYVIELVSSKPLAANDVPEFSEWDQYQAPTVSFAASSLALSSNGTLTGTLLASAFTPAAQLPGDQTTMVSLYYSTTEGTTSGRLINNYYYSNFTSDGSGNPRSFNFTFPGFANLPAGSYDFYAVINDGQNQPVTSALAGPFTETSPTPVVTGPAFLALAPSAGAPQGVFSAADHSALGITTNFLSAVTVNLTAQGGSLIPAGGEPTTDFVQTYASAAAAVAGLDGLTFVAGSGFTGSSTLTYTVTTTDGATAHSATLDIPIVTPNTHLVVTQSVNSNVPGNPAEDILTVTIANPGGPDGQDGTNVQVQVYLSPGLTVVSDEASVGSYNLGTGDWTVGSLPMTGANTATLTLTIAAGPSTQGKALTSTAAATSALFNVPASDAENTIPVPPPRAITFTVTNLNDSGAGSLRAAIDAAQSGDLIQFASSLAGGTIVLSSGELEIDQSITIIGLTTTTAGPDIEISGAGSSRIFDIEGGNSGINVTLKNLTIENGLAGAEGTSTPGAGGGLLINDAGGSLILSNLLISDNVASNAAGSNALGGGIAFLAGNATLSNDTLENNQATVAIGGSGLGGGLYVAAGNVSLNSDTIADNQATGGIAGLGGGVDALGGSVTFSEDTLADNTAAAGGDVYQAAPGFVAASNSIFANPGDAFMDPDFFGTVGLSSHNLIDNSAGSTGFSSAAGDLVNVSADLAPLGNDGGPTPTMPPLPGSPVINAGLVGAQATVTTDQQGGLRQVGGALDIGADEYQYKLGVSGTSVVGTTNLISYTLTVTNSGPDSVGGTTLEDLLPQGVTFQSLSAPAGWTVSAPPAGQGGKVTVTDTSNLNPGSSATFTLVAQAGITTEGTVVENTASVGPTTFDTQSTGTSATLSSSVPELAPIGLAIEAQPGKVVIGQPINPAITVAVVTAAGTAVTSDDRDQVTLSIASGPAGAFLGGTTTVQVVNGIATFSGLTLNLPGSYTLMATAGTLTPALTNMFTVAPVAVTTGLQIHGGPLHKISKGRTKLVMAQTIKITNTSRTALSGPLALAVEGMAAGVTLIRASGVTQGNPYINMLANGKVLKPRKSVSVTLDFAVSGTTPSRQQLYDDLEAMMGI